MGFFGKQKPVSIELGPSLFKAITKVMEDPTGQSDDKRVAYSGRNFKQDLKIVGESNFQESISIFRKGWSYGLLVPEQNNPVDRNAIALFLIDKKNEIHKVGYLSKEIAARVANQIANLLVENGQVIPVLAKVEGGTKDKPELGVFAYARTKSVSF